MYQQTNQISFIHYFALRYLSRLLKFDVRHEAQETMVIHPGTCFLHFTRNNKAVSYIVRPKFKI
jgi:hypothetical protein